jgi:hypothetical protein
MVGDGEAGRAEADNRTLFQKKIWDTDAGD